MIPKIKYTVEGRPLPPGTSPGIVGVYINQKARVMRKVKIQQKTHNGRSVTHIEGPIGSGVRTSTAVQLVEQAMVECRPVVVLVGNKPAALEWGRLIPGIEAYTLGSWSRVDVPRETLVVIDFDADTAHRLRLKNIALALTQDVLLVEIN